MNFVFFHIGEVTQPQLLTLSIKKFNPGSKIYFLTDHNTNEIDGVTETIRFDLDPDNLMTSRLEAFSKLELNEPAIYLDTDVLVVRPIPTSLFNNKEVVLCKRSFMNDLFIKTTFMGLNLKEYDGSTFGEIYPFVACFTFSKNYEFWKECYKTLLDLDKKFHFWYGDQEALRIVYKKNIFSTGLLDERIICTLPEYIKSHIIYYSIHFKGKNRKEMMLSYADKII